MPKGSGQSELEQREKAARKTVQETERRRQFATTQQERDFLEGILDRARRSLAAVTAEIAREDSRRDFVAKAVAGREDEHG